MGKNKHLVLFSFLLGFVFMGIVFADLAGIFSFSDQAFLYGFLVYGIVVLMQRTTSKLSFFIVLSLLLWMGLSYIPTGPGKITERIGEWFYLFFLFGLLQYTHEAWSKSSLVGKQSNATVDWDSYYTDRLRSLQSHMAWYGSWLTFIHSKVILFKPGLRVFEVGSGSGGVLMLLHTKGVSIVGSDVAKKAREIFHQFNDQVPYRHYDIQNKPRNGESFDRVIAFEVLEHIEHLDRAVENIKKLLHSGGYFIGSTPPDTKNFDPTHINVHEPEYWKRLFEKHGFISVETYPMSFLPFLWRIHPKLNIVIPFYVSLPGWISTTLIIAQK